MGPELSHNFTHTCISILLFITVYYVAAQDYFEEHHHKYQASTQSKPLKEIPKRFNVKGEEAIPTFNKYLNDIQELAAKRNISIVYKVKVDTAIEKKDGNAKKRRPLKRKSKKYNVPLKKKSMMLSNYEIISRKRASEFGLKQRGPEETSTVAERHKVLYVTRQTVGKYKPDVGAVKTRYSKIVRPVKNAEFSLET